MFLFHDRLQWLLLEGDRKIIVGYHYSARASKRSRSDLGLMIRKGSWGVPSEFAGTQENNWATRAISASEFRIQNLMATEFLKAL